MVICQNNYSLQFGLHSSQNYLCAMQILDGKKVSQAVKDQLKIDVAQLSADNGVIAVVPTHRKAEVAAFLEAVEVLTTEEPAPRPLVQVPAQRAVVPDQLRSNAMRRLSQQRKFIGQLLRLDDLAEGRHRSDRRPLLVDLDAAQLRNERDIHQSIRQGHSFALHPILHDPGDEIAPSGKHFGLRPVLGENGYGFLNSGRLVQLETFHRRSTSQSHSL